MAESNERYSCQINLPSFGTTAQEKLRQAKVLVVGLGGLGCPAAQYLVSAGVGTVALADADVVSSSNLHRQILFNDQDEGKSKITAAAAALQRQNAEVNIITIEQKITTNNVIEVIEPYDIVLDCTDNFETRYVLSDGCVLGKKPLVYGAAYQYEGQVAVWNGLNNDGSRTPHYRDVFATPSLQEVDCSSGGVLPTLTAVIGSMEAGEAIKYVVGLPGLTSRLLVYNALTMESRITTLPRSSWTPIAELSAPIVKEITVKELRIGLDQKRYQLVDVRTSAERAEYNIGGIHIPLDDILSGNVQIDTSRPTVFYCAAGGRSAAAAAHLHADSAAELLSLAGGVAAWRK